jgi:hypothetical protein
VALAINTYLREGAARVIDPGSVKLTVPEKYKAIVPELMAEIEGLPIETDVVARVVINERTGTVVVGGNVRISPQRWRTAICRCGSPRDSRPVSRCRIRRARPWSCRTRRWM